MITENDVQVGVTLKYLGGDTVFDCSFTVGKLYELSTDLYDTVIVYDDEKDERSLVLDSFELWERYYTGSKPSNEISLTLTQDEAQVLVDLIACVGGCKVLSRRKFTDIVRSKLKLLGIEFNEYYNNCRDISGTIHCKTVFEPESVNPVKETIEYNGSTYDKVEFYSMLANLEKL